MKIGYLTYDINPQAGWGRYSADLIFGAQKLGADIVILKELNDGLIGQIVLKRGKSLLATALKIRKYLADCDIIHALDGYPYGVMAALANLTLKKKLVITAVGTYAVEPLASLKTGFLLRWAYRRADKITAISHYTKEKILEKASAKGGPQPSRLAGASGWGNLDIQVILPGLDFEHFYRPRLTSTEDYILTVGALKERKGYHVSLSAFAAIKDKFPQLKYYIIGRQDETEYFNKLKEIVKRNGLETRVRFLTNLTDEELADYYSKAKLFILTSVNQAEHFEGYGLVFLEAAASGLPVIGTVNNGISDVARDGLNGLLVPQNDVAAASQALEKILGDVQLQVKFSQASYEWAKANDTKQAAASYFKLYEQLVKLN